MRHSQASSQNPGIDSRHQQVTHYQGSSNHHQSPQLLESYKQTQRTEPAQNPGNINQIARIHSNFSFANGSQRPSNQMTATDNQGRSPVSQRRLVQQPIYSNRSKNSSNSQRRQNEKQNRTSSGRVTGIPASAQSDQLIGYNSGAFEMSGRQNLPNYLQDIGISTSARDKQARGGVNSLEQIPSQGEQSDQQPQFEAIPSQPNDFMQNTMQTNDKRFGGSDSGGIIQSSTENGRTYKFLGGTINSEMMSSGDQQLSGRQDPALIRNYYMPMSLQNRITEEREYPTTERSRSNKESNNEMVFRIETLQRYSELCERRILELQPNHPLPVLEEHLGMGNPFIEEMHQHQNQNGYKYSQTGSVLSMSPRSQSLGMNQMTQHPHSHAISGDQGMVSAGSARALRDHFNAVSNKNNQVERALRDETIANEEQRNYIQILKNVIEQKLERDGILQLLKESARRKRSANKSEFNTFNPNTQNSQNTQNSPNFGEARDLDPIDLYIVISDLKHQTESRSKEVQRLIDQLKAHDEQSKTILEENTQLQNQLDEKSEQLKNFTEMFGKFKNELEVLHKQKEELLDCVEMQVQQIDSLKSEIVHERSRQTSLQVPQQQTIMHSSDQMNIQSEGGQSPSVEQMDDGHAEPQIINTQNSQQNLVVQPNNFTGIQTANGTGQVQMAKGDQTNNNSTLIDNNLSYSVGMTSQNQTMQQPEIQSAQLQYINKQQAISAEAQRSIEEQSKELHDQKVENDRISNENQQLQAKLTSVDQHLRQLRGDVDEANQQLFIKDQEIDQLNFSKNQLQKYLDIERQKNSSAEDSRIKEKSDAQGQLYDEKRKIEDLQIKYEQAIKKCQRELMELKTESMEKDSMYDQAQKAQERQAKELELRQTQLEAARDQAQKDRLELQELKGKNDELQIEVDRLQREKEKRQDLSLMEQKTKEQLGMEKLELVTQLNELTHQIEVIKTQKQTEVYKQDQSVRDAKSRTEFLEKANKKQMMEYEVLQKEYTTTAVKLKQAEAQVTYLEKSHKQLTSELRQAKLDIDAHGREQGRHLNQVKDLQQENEQLYRNEEQQRRTAEQVLDLQSTLQTKEQEIEKTDAKLRKTYLIKEEMELEVQSLRKQVATLSLDKQTILQAKDVIFSQARESEKRIFELTKQRQDQDSKIRENAAFIKELVGERDRFKSSSEAKEEEILELSDQVKALRTSYTDLKLIEEKVDTFLQDIMLVADNVKRTLRQQLDDFLHLVKKSDNLANKVSIRQRDQGHTYLEELMSNRSQGESGVQAYQNMQRVRDSMSLIGNVAKYNADMLEIFVSESVNMFSDIVTKDRKVNHLEEKLGSIHSVDYKAQHTVSQLQSELQELKTNSIDYREKAQMQIKELEESLNRYRTMSETLGREKLEAEQRLEKTLGENTEPPNVQVSKQLQQSKIERSKLQGLVQRLQASISKEIKVDQTIDKMLASTLQLAKAESDREHAIQDIDRLEVKLATAIEQGDERPLKMTQEETQSAKLSTIRKVKDIRSELASKEQAIRDLEDRAGLEADRLRSLEMELRQQLAGSLGMGSMPDGRNGMFNEYGHDGMLDDRPSRDVPFGQQRSERTGERMTHSMETLLKETKDLRQQLQKKNEIISTLEQDLPRTNSYHTFRQTDQNSNTINRGGTFSNEIPEHLIPVQHSPMRRQSPQQMRGTYDQPVTKDFKMRVDI